MDHILNTSTVNFLRCDGYIKSTKLSKVVKTLPNKYRGNKGNLRILVADDIYQDYNDYLGARAVSTADPYLLGVGRLTYSNIPISAVSLLPVDRPVEVGGVDTTLTDAQAAGTNTIQVANADDIVAGQTLALDLGTGYEEVVTVAEC